MLKSYVVFAESNIDEILSKAPVAVKESIEANLKLGINNQKALKMYERLTKSNINVPIQNTILSKLALAHKNGLNTDIVVDKISEGLAKSVHGEQIAKAVDTTMDRLRFSKEVVSKINAREEIRERISQNIYDALTAGMTQQQVEAVMSQSKAKSDAEIAVAISDLSKDLARAKVAASTVTEISIGILKNSYSPSEINQVRSAFKDNVRSQDPGYLAGRLKSDVARGYRAGDVQRGMSGGDHGSSGSMGHGSGGRGSGGRGK
jgi:hypothetical protein